MKIQFRYRDKQTFQSPEFPLTEDQEEIFFDEYLGSEDEDGSLFWESDVSKNNDMIFVDWFVNFTQENAEHAAKELGKVLHESLADFSKWSQQ
jgi:hypothetical protein